jgi:hypothetical protein
MDAAGFNILFNTQPTKTVWAILYALEALALMLWIPSLIAISIRELSNSATGRVLISSYAIGILIAIFYFFMRPPFILS